jgi:hypothetical protein
MVCRSAPTPVDSSRTRRGDGHWRMALIKITIAPR